jgi:curved DNA-binding protein
VLGVGENAPKEVVRGAYRALAQKHHPDNGGEQAEFERIKHAYDAGMEAR